MVEEFAQGLDDRNVLSWSEDSATSSEYREKIKQVREQAGRIDKSSLDKKIEELEQERNAKLTRIGIHRQKILDKTKVMVIGTGPLAQMVSAGLVGLGVGKVDAGGYICVAGNENIKKNEPFDILITKNNNLGLPKVDCIIKRLAEIDHRPKYDALYSKFTAGQATASLEPDIIIEASNSLVSKNKVVRYCNDKRVPLISLSSCRRFGTLACYWPTNGRIPVRDTVHLDSLIHREYDGLPQDIITSGVTAGLGLEEFRKKMFSMSDADKNLESFDLITYNPYSRTRNSRTYDISLCNKNLKTKKVLVCGAGALGNFVTLALALYGVGHIDIIDNDHVELSNLNRQFIAFDKQHVGIQHKKSKVLLDRIKLLKHPLKGKAIVDKITENSDKMIKEGKYDLLLGCFDNRRARAALEHLADKYLIPYVDGGSTPISGQVIAYIPRVTPKFTEQFELSEDSASCDDEPDPSVVMSNMVIGSAMAAEAIKFLADHPYKKFVGQFDYMGIVERRIWFTPYEI